MKDESKAKSRLIDELQALREKVGELESLRQEEQQTRRMLKEAQRIGRMGYWELDLLSNRLYWSDEIYRIFGLEPQEFKATYEAFLERIHPDDREYVDKTYTDSVKNRIPCDIVHRLLLEDGTIKHVNENCVTEYDEAGKPVLSIGTVQDITERKRAEEALRESQGYVQNLVESSLDMIIAVDMRRRIKEFNRAAEETFGYQREEVLGKHVNLLYADPRKGLAAHKKTVLNGQHVQEILNRRKNGETFPCLLSASVLRDAEGEIVGVMGVSRDITERKRAEEALLESEERFRSIVENSHDGILIVDEAFHFVYTNDQLCQILGYSREEIIGSDFRKFLDEESKELVTDRYLRRQRGEEVPARCELSVVRKDGEKRRAKISSTVIKNSDGRVKTVAQVLDITESKRTEEELLYHAQLLENVTDSIISDDMDENIIYWNRAAEQQYGWLAEEVIGRHITEIVPVKVKNMTREDVRKIALTDGKWSGEAIHYTRDGEELIVDWVVSAVRNKAGELIGTLGNSHDITHIRRAEEALQESKKMLQLVLDTIPVRVFWKDCESVYLGCNRLFAHGAGLESPDEIIGKNDLDLVWREQAELYRADDRQVIKTGVPKIDYEESQSGLDGITLWLRTSKVPLVNLDGSIIGMLGTYEDITERKQAEGQLRTLSQTVEQSPISVMVADLEGNLEYANPKFEELTGYSVEEVLGENPRFLQSGNTPPEVYEELWNTITAGDTWHGQFHNKRKNGELYLENATVGSIKNERGEIIQYLAVKADITEKVRTEEALQDSERRYRQLIEEASDTVFGVDPKGYCIYANAPASVLTGYSNEELTGILFTELIRPDWQERVQSFYLQQRNEAIPESTLEFPIVTKTGAEKWVEQKTTILSEGATVTGLQGIVREITERKKAEEALKESKERYRSVIDSAPGFIFLLDSAGKVLDLDLSKDDYFHPELLVTSQIFDYVLEEDRDLFESEIKTCLTNLENRSFTVRTQDRSTIYRVLLAPVYKADGIAETLVCNFYDITSQKLNERKIEEQAALLDITQDAIGVVDMDGNIIYWNKSAERVYGWSQDEILKTGYRGLLDTSGPEAAEKGELPVSDVLESGEWIGDLRHVTKDGRSIIVESRVSLVRGENDKPSAFLFSNTDITKRREMEAQVLRAQRMESIGLLAGGIAHDLNNVLGPILMSAQILKKKVSDEKGIHILDILANNARRGAEIVKQVLTFARGSEEEHTVLQPKYLLKEIINITQETFPKSITIESNIPKDLWPIKGDPTQLHQVLLNLAVNARDAMPSSGNMTIQAKNHVIKDEEARFTGVLEPGAYVCIEIADTGSGMSKKIVEHIFDPFFTTKAKGQGTGLGLVTVDSIVRTHQGFIDVTSTPGEGSTFKVYLPSSVGAEIAEEEPLVEELPLGHGEMILLIDDEASIREITKEALESSGYEVMTAVDGSEGIAVYAHERDRIDLVLIDMMMPIMDGPATIRTLKKINPDLKIIAASGAASHQEELEAMELGAMDFLRKPFTADTLLVSLDKILHK